MRTRHQNAGFSLVEVMCAILILGVALVGLTQGITTALGSSKESELQTTAALIAAGQIETLRAEGILTDGVKEGDCGNNLALYRWKETISSTSIAGLHDVAALAAPGGRQTRAPGILRRQLLFVVAGRVADRACQIQ